MTGVLRQDGEEVEVNYGGAPTRGQGQARARPTSIRVLGMTSPRVGVQLEPQHADFEGIRRAWREADEMGADSIFCWDHFFPLSGDADGKHYEAIALLGAMAEV